MAESRHNTKGDIYIFYTGGTIGMAPEDPAKPGSPLVPKPLDELLNYAPRLKELGLRIDYDSFDKPLDSSNIVLEDWVKIAKKLEAAYDHYDGFIVLHGTDTMCYTSSALSFMCENLAKPIVITGSQLPISHPRTDAVMNLVNSVYIAGYRHFGLPCVPEVVIVFADKIIRGCRARKTSATSWAGFESPNCPLLGTIGEHIRIDTSLLRPLPGPGQQFQVATDLVDRVMDVVLTPTLKPKQLRHILAGSDTDPEVATDGIVLRAYGTGNAPDRAAFLDVIGDVVANGKAIVNTTQCLEGMVEMGLYAASSGLLERGVISALDMTPEAALTKLMWTLGTKIGDQVTTQMQVNQRGEQSANLFDLRYGSCGVSTKPEPRFVKYVTPDRRFDVSRLSRAVIRITGLGLAGVTVGDSTTIRVFMNLPSATAETPLPHPKCIAEVSVVWTGAPLSVAQEIDDTRARSAIGEGDITLSIVSGKDILFWFQGLYLALFAKA
jgi:L-asparaginase